MRPALLFLLVAAAGCTGSQALHLSRADVVGTTWRETCLSPQIATAYVRLDADGHMAWSYDGRTRSSSRTSTRGPSRTGSSC